MQSKPSDQAHEQVARASLRQSAFTTNRAPRMAGGLAAALLWVGTFPAAATTVTIEPAIITLNAQLAPVTGSAAAAQFILTERISRAQASATSDQWLDQNISILGCNYTGSGNLFPSTPLTGSANPVVGPAISASGLDATVIIPASFYQASGFPYPPCAATLYMTVPPNDYFVDAKVWLNSHRKTYYFEQLPTGTGSPDYVDRWNALNNRQMNEEPGVMHLKLLCPTSGVTRNDLSSARVTARIGGTIQAEILQLPSGVTQLDDLLFVRDGGPYNVTIEYTANFNNYLDKFTWGVSLAGVTAPANALTPTDVFLNSLPCADTVTYCSDGITPYYFGHIIGNADLVGFPENPGTRLVAGGGLYGNFRYGPPPPHSPSYASGPYLIQNIMGLDAGGGTTAGHDYSVHAEMSFPITAPLSGLQAESLSSPCATAHVTPCQTNDIGNVLVMTPGFVQGNIFLKGLADTVNCPCVSRLDLPGSRVRASGACSASANVTFGGSFSGGDFTGDYKLALAELNPPTGFPWQANVLDLYFNNPVLGVQDNHLTITDDLFPAQSVPVGATLPNDHNYCFSYVTFEFVNSNPARPFTGLTITGAGGFVSALDFQGNPADYDVAVQAYGMATTSPGMNAGTVVACLPEGTYTVTPAVTYPEGSATVPQISFTIGCGQKTNIVVWPRPQGDTNCCHDCPTNEYVSYTVHINANTDYYLVNHLCKGTNNTLATVLSDVPPSTTVWKYNCGGYTAYAYDPDDLTWVPDANATLNPGEGFMLRSPTAFDLTFTGCEPDCPPRCLSPTNCCELVGRAGIGAATWDDLSSCPPECGTQVRIWNGTGFNVFDYVAGAWTPFPPVLAVGQSAFVCWVSNSNCVSCTNNSLVNGSFESPGIGNNTYDSSLVGVPGWTGTDSQTNPVSLEFWSGTFGGMVAQDGQQHLEINGNIANQCVSQVVTNLSTNCLTRFCFWYIGRPGFADNSFVAEIIGSGLPPMLFNPPAYTTNTGWLEYCVEFFPVSTTLTIKFTATSGGGVTGGAHVDNVLLAQCCSNNPCSSPLVVTCSTNKTLPCGTAWSFDSPTAVSACCGTNLTITALSTFTNGICQVTHTRIWQITDCLTNTATCTQTVTVVDFAQPVITCASNKTVECGTAWEFDLPVASDDCSGTNVTVSVLFSNTNGICPVVHDRTWIVWDQCGNSNFCVQVVTVVDTTPPMLTCASNKTVQCNQPWSFDPPTAWDACSSNDVTYTILGTTTNGTCPQDITRFWQVTDACGNSNTCSQTVSVVDITPPLLSVCLTNRISVGTVGDNFVGPEAASPSAGLLTRLAGANSKGFDDCTVNRVFAHTFADLPGCITAARLTVRLRPCGDVCFNDTIGLSFTSTNGTLLPGSWGRYLGTSGNPSAGLVAGNWCSSPGQVFSLNLGALPLAGGGTTDLLPQLNANGFVDFTLQDDSAIDYLVLEVTSCCCDTNVTVNCADEWGFATPVAVDDCCTNVTISVLNATTNGLCPQTVTWTWLATDCCGNSNTCSRTVTVLDTKPPLLTCGADKSVLCETAWVFNPPFAVDDCCGTNVAVTVLNTLTNSGGCPTLITRTWQATDCCSNSASCSQTVTIIDNTPPVISGCTNIFVTLTNGQTSTVVNFTVTATDTCSNPVLLTVTPPAGTFSPGVYPITATAVDACGNSNFCNFTVTVQGGTNCCDGCVEPYPASYTNIIYPGFNYLANHLCPGTNNTLEVLIPIVPDGTEIYKWNYNTQSLEPAATYFAGFGWSPSTTLDPGEGYALVSPAAAPFELVFSGCEPTCPPPCLSTNGCVLVGRLGIGTATWTNLSSCPPVCGTRLSIWNPNTQEFMDYDFLTTGWTPSEPVVPLGQSAMICFLANTNCQPCTNALTIACATNAIIVGNDPGLCGAVVNYNPPVVTGGCSTSISTNCVPPSGTFFPLGTSTVTCTVSNDLGQTAQCAFTITVFDVEPPLLTCASNRTVECGTIWEFEAPSVSDPCCSNITVTVLATVVTNLGPCVEIFTRTWAASDCASNTATCSQSVTVMDTTPPVVTCASNRTVLCGQAWSFDPPTASDACNSNNVSFTVQSLVTNGVCPQEVILTWLVSDVCGNTNTCSQTVTIIDTTPPVFGSGAAVMTPFTNRPVWQSAACSTPAINFSTLDNGDPITDPSSDTAFASLLLSGVEFVNVRSYWNAALYVGPNQPLRVNLPPGTVSFGADIFPFYGNAGTYTITLSTGHVFTQSASLIPWTPDFFGVTSTAPIAWVEFMYDHDYLMLDNFSFCTAPVAGTGICLTNRIGVGTVGDNFTGPEAATPSAGLLTRLAGANRKGFDDCTVNRVFAHTFANLPGCITEARLTVRLKPCGDSCYNDTMGLSFTGTNGAVLPGSWGRYLGTTGNPQPGLVAGNWCSSTGQVFILDLAALPLAGGGTTDLLPMLNANGFLDFTVQDDSAIDYLVLDITSCGCCDSNVTVLCGTEWGFLPPTAVDNCCSTVTVSLLTAVTNGTCPQTISSTWVATDCCGNTNTCTRSVTLLDQTPPVIVCATNKSVPCGTAWSFDTPTAFDLCCGPSVTVSLLSSNLISTSPCQVTFAGVWQATDCCSNSITCTQMVTVVDATLPVFTGCPTNSIVLPCNSVPSCATVAGLGIIATDLCSGNITPVCTAGVVSTAGCQRNQTFTMTATDACQNSSSCQITFTWTVDTTPPTVTCATNKTVPCGSAWSFDPPGVSDDCCTNVGVTLISSNLSLVVGCEKTYSGVWLAMDCCNNSITCTQQVTVVVSGPKNPPAIAGFHHNAAGMHIRIHTLPCYIYALECKDSLGGSAWNICQSLAGDGTDLEFHDTAPLPAMRFYRVRLLCP